MLHRLFRLFPWCGLRSGNKKIICMQKEITSQSEANERYDISALHDEICNGSTKFCFQYVKTQALISRVTSICYRY